MPDRNLGQALTNDFQAGAGTARIHEGGLVASAPGVTLTAWFNLPPIARPTILSGEPASRPAFSIDVDAEGDGWTVAELPGIVDAALAGRVGLTPLGGGDTATLSVGAAQGGIAGVDEVASVRIGAGRTRAARRDRTHRQWCHRARRTACGVLPPRVERLRPGTHHGHARGAPDRSLPRTAPRGTSAPRRRGDGQLERQVPWLRQVRQLSARARRPRRHRRDR